MEESRSFAIGRSKLSTPLTVVLTFLFLLLGPFQSETWASNSCEAVFQDKAGAQFLASRDNSLHTSSFVEKAARLYQRVAGQKLTKPADKIQAWLTYLEKLANRASSSPFALDKIKKSLHQTFVIKPESIPESYYAFQVRLARERGHGDIVLSAAQKTQLADTLVKDQKASLDVWTEYLVSKDTSMYPMWLKYWMYTGMARLSKYDPATGSFGSRSKETVSPFPEINREALAYIADAVLTKLNKQSLDQIQDPEFRKLLDGMNFGKLYGQTLFRMGVGKEGKFSTNEGRWVVFKQGSDHRPLVKSLEGQNTGWCTAGKSTAREQLSNGDFHVFYSLDENRQPTIPRVAIRMEGDKIAEVRGVAKDQNMDSQIASTDTVSAKMREFGERGKVFEKKDRDMKMLTALEAKHRLGQELSVQELRFLYEIDENIAGFGYQQDPRIEAIRKDRDLKADLVLAFENRYQKHEISLTTEEALSGHSKYHYGDLDLKSFTSAQGLKLPDSIGGNLYLDKLKSAQGLKLPDSVGGNLSLNNLTSAQGLKLPDSVGGNLYLFRLTSAQGLKFPKSVGGHLDLTSLASAQGLKLPKSVGGHLDLNSLASALGLKLPETVGGHLYLLKLTSAQGLKLPKFIGGSVVGPRGLSLTESLLNSLYE